MFLYNSMTTNDMIAKIEKIGRKRIFYTSTNDRRSILIFCHFWYTLSYLSAIANFSENACSTKSFVQIFKIGILHTIWNYVIL